MDIFMVKKIKGHYYVYMEYRERGEYKVKLCRALREL